MKIIKAAQKRLLSKVNKLGPFPNSEKYPNLKTRCWVWMGGTNNGYGRINIQGRNWQAHRWLFLTEKCLQSKPSECVLHKCDNRACVNPDHMFIGDRKANVYDMVFKKRNVPVCGERNNKHKLAESDVKHLRGLEKNYGFLSRHASRLGVFPSTIQRAIEHNSWRHI